MSARTERRSHSGRGGFTLVEALIASIIVGLGVTAVLMASKSGTQVNAHARDVTRATYLGQEIREWMVKMSFEDIGALSDVTYSPPRDATGQQIADMSGWSQQITLTWRNPTNISQTVADGTSEIIYAEVVILHEGQSVLTTGWLVTQRE